jgi:hypothetical protein
MHSQNYKLTPLHRKSRLSRRASNTSPNILVNKRHAHPLGNLRQNVFKQLEYCPKSIQNSLQADHDDPRQRPAPAPLPPGPGEPSGAETLPDEETVKDDNNLGERPPNMVNTDQ